MKARTKMRPQTDRPHTASKLVYTQAPILLGRLIEPTRDGGWLVELAQLHRNMKVDPAVDPALLEQAQRSGARVIIDATSEPCIVGVVATHRAVEIDAEGRVLAKVRAFTIDADEEVLLRVPGAFVRAMGREVETYGERVITRARNLAKVMAAMIKLN